jgi:dehydrogenase/reductase SDR family protein 4
MIGRELFSLRGKVAIVTGSTRGIGLATIRLLAQQGASVVVSSRKPEACNAVCAQLLAAGAAAIAIPAHAGREADCRRLIDETQSQFGRLDIVVANAAVNPVFEAVSTVAEESWQKVLDTNLTGPWRLARFALPLIAEQGGGALVFVSSITARLGVPRAAGYGVSKAALEQLTRQLAIEWGGKNVRINAVAPGTTRTDMIRALAADPSFLAAVEASTPMGRIGEAEDVAGAIVFLASDAARHITGQVLTVDGGETIYRGTREP